MEDSSGEWGIAICGIVLLVFLCWKQAGWDQEADVEEYDSVRDCYVMKADRSPSVDTNSMMRMECR